MTTGYDDNSAKELLDRIQEQYEPENMEKGPWHKTPAAKRELARIMLMNAVRILEGECILQSVHDSRGRSKSRYVINFDKQEDFNG